MSLNIVFLKLVPYYKMLLKSQLLFINYRRFPQYTFCLPKTTIVKHQQQNNTKSQLKKYTHLFFKISKDHKQIFQEDGLLNLSSSRIRALLQEKAILAMQNAKDWLDMKIQVDSINTLMFENYLNFQFYLLKEKDNYPQIQSKVAERDEKTMHNFLHSSNNLVGYKKMVDFLIYCQRCKKENNIDILRDKIVKQIKDQNQLINLLKEILKDNYISDNFKKQFIQKLTLNYNVNVLINAQVPLSFIPPRFYTNQKKELFQAMRQRIQNQQNLKPLMVLIKYLLHLKQDIQQVSMIVMILNKFIRRIIDKKKCVQIEGAQFIKIILENQQTTLLFYYLIENKSDSTFQNFINLSEYRSFAKKDWLTRFLLCILIHKKQKSLEQEAIQAVRPAFKDLHTFLSIYQSIRMLHLQQFFPQLAQYFKYQIIALDNPFYNQTNQHRYTLKQKALFIQFFFRSFHYKDKHELVKKYNYSITYEVKKEFIRYHLDQDCQLQPQKYGFYFINQEFDAALVKLDKEFLRLGIILLEKYEKIGVERTENQYSELKFWKLFKNYIQNINAIIQVGLGQQIIVVLQSIITNNYKFYKQDYHYRQLLKNLLNHLKSFEFCPHFMVLVIKSAMKYPSIINPLALKDIKIPNDSLGPQQYKKYLTLKGQKTNLDLLNEKNLSILFINQTYLQQIKLHKTKIINIINCAKMNSCIEAINSFGMSHNKESIEILKALLMRIINDSVPADLKGNIDLMGIFLNCLKNQQFFMIQFNKIWHLIIKIYLGDIQELTIQMHIFLIQFSFTQSSNMLDQDLLHSYLRNIITALYRNTIAYQSTELSLFFEIARSGSIKFSMEDKKRIKILMRLDFYHSQLKGTSFIILFQKNLSEQEMKQQIAKLQEYHKRQLQSDKEYLPFIYDLHYAYIKNKYAKFSEGLKLSQEHLKPYNFTMEYKMDSQFLKELMQELKAPLQYSLKFGANNIIKIHDYFLVFLHPYKNSCIGQQKAIANIIQSIHGSPCKVVFLLYSGSQTYQMEILKTLSQRKKLLSKQSYEKLISSHKQRKQGYKKINVTYSHTDFISQQGFEINSIELDDKDSEQKTGKQQ